MKFTFQIIEGSKIWLVLSVVDKTDNMDPRSSQDDLISSNNESQTLDSNSKQTMERFNILDQQLLWTAKYKPLSLYLAVEGSLSSL